MAEVLSFGVTRVNAWCSAMLCKSAPRNLMVAGRPQASPLRIFL
jgi:hypothetical protein